MFDLADRPGHKDYLCAGQFTKAKRLTTLRKPVDQVRAQDALTLTVEIISAGTNLGFAKGVNFVIAHDRQAQSPHDYYLLLNNDAVAGPGLVAGLLRALKHEPEAVLAAPRVVSSDSSKREHGVWYHRYLGLLYSRPGTVSLSLFYRLLPAVTAVDWFVNRSTI